MVFQFKEDEKSIALEICIYVFEKKVYEDEKSTTLKICTMYMFLKKCLPYY